MNENFRTLKEPHALTWDDRLRDDDKKLVEKLNATMRKLSELRAIELPRSGPFARSKIAWKLARYQHSVLHRIVDLADGTAETWNCRCSLSAFLSVRAFMETLAVMEDFKEGVGRFLAAEDLASLDALVQKETFATRDKEMLKDHPEITATNVLTFVQRLDKQLPGFLRHYDMLSERCHPNYLGHSFMFSEVDHNDATVRFTGSRDPQGDGILVFGGLILLLYVEPLMTELDDLILKVSDLHHRIAPVGGKTG